MNVKRMIVTFSTLLALAATGIPAWGQVAKPRSGADVNLVAMLNEAMANPEKRAAMAKAGAKAASFCANCHGDGGNSVKPEVPNLAGQNASYLMEQMLQYMDGRRRNSEFKQRLIKVLSPAEKVGMILYFSHQPVAYKPATNIALAATGKVVYKRDCADCHMDDGHGTEKFARVAGQQAEYLNQTIRTYRDGASTRSNGQMTASLRGISDADIAAVVAYVASMK